MRTRELLQLRLTRAFKASEEAMRRARKAAGKGGLSLEAAAQADHSVMRKVTGASEDSEFDDLSDEISSSSYYSGERGAD